MICESSLPKKKSRVDLLEDKVMSIFESLSSQINQLRAVSIDSRKKNRKEVQSSIPRADPQIEEQGYSCQKMNSNSWNNSNSAAPVFIALEVNPQLAGLVNLTSHSQKILARTDTALSTITHGILKERD
ncbi:unnamed protein product [Parnassius apollo]|uniref:(apollo) hypothetical protein n=1 Tax=Parnassius apollo TaxID=110799 RepID=A0A8S3XAK3_PARAO|nr:unnamed protein product [Parnassius apollo]